MKNWMQILILALLIGIGIWCGYLLKKCPNPIQPTPIYLDPTGEDSIRKANLILTIEIQQLKKELITLKNKRHETKIIYLLDSIKPDTTNIPAIFREWAGRYN